MRLPWRRRGALNDDQRDALGRIVSNTRFEVIPLRNVMERAAPLPAGSTVTVTASPGRGLERTIEVATALAGQGHRVVPHLAARMVRDRHHLADLLASIREAGIRRAFVVGGDATGPGQFPTGLSLLRALVECGDEWEELGVPAYPEGHVSIADDALLRDLIEKQRLATYMVTQLCLDADAIVRWVGDVRANGLRLPVLIGLPGPVDVRKLINIVAKTGIGDALGYVRKNRRTVGRMLARGGFEPDGLLAQIGPVLGDSAGIAGIHLFTFNEVDRSVRWRDATAPAT
jgi:methylenetetrahydrofolate reductase (NADPH)